MLPVLYRFTFLTPGSKALLFLLALGIVAYAAWSGWRNADVYGADGKLMPATTDERRYRATLYGLIGVVLAGVGLFFALPPSELPATTVRTLLSIAALPLLGLGGWTGWRMARGAEVKGQPTEPSAADRRNGAIRGVVVAGVAVGVGIATFGSKVLIGQGEGIPIHTYGVLVGAGFITAVTVAAWLAVREWPGELGLKRRDQLFDLAFWVFIAAMVGSRVLFIFVNWKDYAADPIKIFSLGGGLVFYGGLIGATLMSLWYAKRNDIEFLRLADLAIPTVSLGQAFGRLGCFSAGCCWGDIAKTGTKLAVSFPGTNAQTVFGGLSNTPSLAWSSQRDDARWVVEATGQIFHQAVPGAVQISHWAADHGHTLPVHPTQLYESFGQMVVFVSLLTMRKFRRFHGQIFGMWLMAYAVLRSTVELFRGDVERGTLNGLLNYLGLHALAQSVPLEAWYNISISQFISLCMFSLGSWTLMRGFQAVKARPAVDVSLLTPAAPASSAP